VLLRVEAVLVPDVELLADVLGVALVGAVLVDGLVGGVRVTPPDEPPDEIVPALVPEPPVRGGGTYPRSRSQTKQVVFESSLFDEQ